jgi:hypothetical protein
MLLLLTCRGDGWQKTVCTASGGKCLDSTSCKVMRIADHGEQHIPKPRVALQCLPQCCEAAMPGGFNIYIKRTCVEKGTHAGMCQAVAGIRHMQAGSATNISLECRCISAEMSWQLTCVRRRMKVDVWRCSSLQRWQYKQALFS